MKTSQEPDAQKIDLGFITNFLQMKIHDLRLGPNTLYRVLFSTSHFPIPDEKIPVYVKEDFKEIEYYPLFTESFKKLIQLIALVGLIDEELAEVIFSRTSLFDLLEAKGYFLSHITLKGYFPLSPEERLLMAA